MAKICVAGDLVFVASGKHIKVFDRTKSGQVHTLEVPPTVDVKGDELTKKPAGDPTAGKTLTIQCLRTCTCGQHLATCDNNKGLCVWRVSEQFQLIFQRRLQRNALCLAFLNKCSQIVVADKTGDVYMYDLSVQDDVAKGKLLFGHLSIILDIVVSPDSHRIVTCDRDEKIRVSCYPNCYNVNSFCLGHSEFVIRMMLFPSQPQILVSASGDGTIKFWQYDTGKLMHTIDCSSNVHVPNVISEKDELTKNEGSLAIKNMTLSCDPQPSVAVLFHKLPLIGLYRTVFDAKSGSLSSSHLQNLPLQTEPWDACFDARGNLFVLCPTENDTVTAYRATQSDASIIYSQCADQDVTDVISDINRDWTFFNVSLGVPSIIPPLFKQWFDNVNTYLASKEERLKKKSSANVLSSNVDPECVLSKSKRPKTEIVE